MPHHQNTTAPCHHSGDFLHLFLNHPFVQQPPISIFKSSSVGRWGCEPDAGCEAISTEARAGGVVGVFIRYRRVDSLNCTCWEEKKKGRYPIIQIQNTRRDQGNSSGQSHPIRLEMSKVTSKHKVLQIHPDRNCLNNNNNNNTVAWCSLVQLEICEGGKWVRLQTPVRLLVTKSCKTQSESEKSQHLAK